MSRTDPPLFRASLGAYERDADALLAAQTAGDDTAAWRFRWEHPRFRDAGLDKIRAADVTRDDARLVIAREQAFDTWADLAAFVAVVQDDGPAARFESAVDAVVSGDLPALCTLLAAHPELVAARSTRRHHATLLHYVAANGVEGARQRTPANAVEIARLLLESGAEADALADLYGGRCTTLSLVVSSAHPEARGVQADLAEALLDHGAALEGPGSKWRSALLTALAFGYLRTAERLRARGAPSDSLAAAAGLGRTEDVLRRLPDADTEQRAIALALAAQHGHVDVVRLLLDAGLDVDAYNPEGFHPHTTPLHQAVWQNHAGVVRLLAERGARLDRRDRIYGSTPLDWALHAGHAEIAAYLRGRGAPTT